MIVPDYVLPLRWEDDLGLVELTDYLHWLVGRARVIIVDGSPPEIFAVHARTWQGLLVHVAPEDRAAVSNGKVAGVLTGMRMARSDKVIIADDDVRYDEQSLNTLLELLDEADLVGPQNVFWPMPWHARYDTARTLLNRAFGADYPGTFGVRASTFRAMGGYDGNVLFENLELMRTVRAAGGRVLRPRSLYVRRLAPQTNRFWNQRVRQAYDDLAQPMRLAWALAVVPGLVRAVARRDGRSIAATTLGVIATAELGRRRAGGARVFPATSSLLAPVWVLERGACSWAAVYLRLVKGGVHYAGRRVAVAAHRPRTVRRLVAERSRAVRRPLGASAEAVGLVRPVAERFERGPAATT